VKEGNDKAKTSHTAPDADCEHEDLKLMTLKLFLN
jgi:hypothetical protein